MLKLCSLPDVFQVMIQPHNRQMSFSLYISALSIADTMVVLTGKSDELYCIKY